MLKRSGFKKPTFEQLMKARNKPRKALKVTKWGSSRSKVSKLGNSPKTGKRMIYGVKVWSLKRADTEFSQWLRSKFDYTCEMCGFYEPAPTQRIQCSHYIGRSNKATRYDPDNCDVLCATCHHKMEDLKQYDYRDWKINKMGEEAHTALRQKGNTSLGEKDSIFNCMKLLGKL